MADINFGILDTQMPGRIAAIPQQQQAQQAQNAMQLMQVQQTMQQNALAKAKMEEYTRGTAEKNALRGRMTQPGFNIYDPAHQADLMGLSPELASPIIQHALQVRQTEAATSKANFELTGQKIDRARTAITAAPNSEAALAAINKSQAAGDIDAADAAILTKELGNDATFAEGQKRVLQSMLSAKDRLMFNAVKPQVVGNRIVNMNPAADIPVGAPIAGAPTIPQSAVARAQADLTAAIARGAPLAEITALTAAVNAPLVGQQQNAQRLAQGDTGIAIRQRELDPYGMLPPVSTGGGGGVPRVNNLGTTTPAPAPQTPAGVAPKLTLADAFKNNVTGPEFIALIPPQVKPVVESILRYDQRPPSTATKQGLRLLELVNQADPTYDAGKAQTRYIAKQTFVKGPVADAIASTNTAIDHMDTLAKYGADLNNTDVRLANVAKQGIAAAFGADAPTTFDATRRIVGQEVVKAVVANGGSMREREEAAGAFNRANSPAQLAGVIKSYQALLGGRLKSTQLRYENDTGLKDFQAKLLPATIRAISGAEATPAGAALTPADQQALDWAAANPNDPRAAQIRQKNGVK